VEQAELEANIEALENKVNKYNKEITSLDEERQKYYVEDDDLETPKDLIYKKLA